MVQKGFLEILAAGVGYDEAREWLAEAFCCSPTTLYNMTRPEVMAKLREKIARHDAEIASIQNRAKTLVRLREELTRIDAELTALQNRDRTLK